MLWYLLCPSVIVFLWFVYLPNLLLLYICFVLIKKNVKHMFSDGVSRHKGVYLFEIFNMLLNVFLRLLKYFNTFQIKYSQYETIWKKKLLNNYEKDHCLTYLKTLFRITRTVPFIILLIHVCHCGLLYKKLTTTFFRLDKTRTGLNNNNRSVACLTTIALSWSKTSQLNTTN